MDDIISGDRIALSFGLMGAGVLLSLVLAFWIGESLLSVALVAVLILGGLYVVSPGAAAMIVGMFALFFVWLWLFYLSEKRYEKNFPVFVTEPVWVYTRENGFVVRMHIAEVGSRFIIGVQYDVEVDESPMVRTTRWKDEYSTYEEAADELRRRAPDFGAAP